MHIPNVSLLPCAISDLYVQTCESGQISLSDRFVLGAAVLNNLLSEDELFLLDRMVYSVRRGNLKLINEL